VVAAGDGARPGAPPSAQAAQRPLTARRR
jgi:hypothetical protein